MAQLRNVHQAATDLVNLPQYADLGIRAAMQEYLNDLQKHFIGSVDNPGNVFSSDVTENRSKDKDECCAQKHIEFVAWEHSAKVIVAMDYNDEKQLEALNEILSEARLARLAREASSRRHLFSPLLTDAVRIRNPNSITFSEETGESAYGPAFLATLMAQSDPSTRHARIRSEPLPMEESPDR
ncbi:hypothetical protein V500_01331 [Pseudogymnoascus sp. VKM F-4518 (FW-2643)]|nr:hypothetical protein V500_01331 [Pseudogymnoascus sp. VKM F-4518 (FW-2643)]